MKFGQERSQNRNPWKSGKNQKFKFSVGANNGIFSSVFQNFSNDLKRAFKGEGNYSTPLARVSKRVDVVLH